MLSEFFLKKNLVFGGKVLLGWGSVLNFHLEDGDEFSARWVGRGWILGLEGWITGVVVLVYVGGSYEQVRLRANNYSSGPGEK